MTDKPVRKRKSKVIDVEQNIDEIVNTENNTAENTIDDKPIEKIKKNKIKSEVIETTKVVNKPISIKDKFLDAISKPPYSIFQNGKLIAVYNPLLKIIADDSAFTINNKKYTYTGIEIKHA